VKNVCKIQSKNIHYVNLENNQFIVNVIYLLFTIILERIMGTFKHNSTVLNSVHPSIHFLYLLNQLVGSRGGLSQQSLGERQGTPWTDRQSITGPHRDERDKQPHTCSYSLLGTILETPINLTCMFLDGGRKPEYPEITHAYTGRT